MTDIDSIALAAAQDIALMWGQDRGQFVAKIQVRISEAITLAQNAQGEAVAEVDAGEDGLFVEILYGSNGSPLKIGDKLYLHAERARVPDGMVLVDREVIENADVALSMSKMDGEHWTQHESPRFELRKALGLPYEKAAIPSQPEGDSHA